MAHFVHFLVVSAVLAVACCHPFSFGGGVSAKSHTVIGADGKATAGAEKDVGATAKGRGFFDWIGSLTGGAYVGNKDGQGYGVGGSLGSAVGGGIKGKGSVGGNGSSEDDGIAAHAGGQGYLDKEGHANVFGDIHAYDADQIKGLVARNKNYGNQGYKNDNDDGLGARSLGSEEWK